MHKLIHSNKFAEFEEAYLRVRAIEKRLLSDDEVRLLPDSTNPRLKGEWLTRKHSFKVLQSFLKGKKGRLLDLGCGNGWMSHHLSKMGFNVSGLDTNLSELEQAERVFQNDPIDWFYADIFDFEPEENFDVIILSASLQYFIKPGQLFEKLFSIMNRGGHLIVMDTPIYQPSGIDAARERSSSYYHGLGEDDMIDRYHHHSFIEFKPFDFEYIYKPKNYIWRKLFKQSTFPIVRVINNLEN